MYYIIFSQLIKQLNSKRVKTKVPNQMSKATCQSLQKQNTRINKLKTWIVLVSKKQELFSLCMKKMTILINSITYVIACVKLRKYLSQNEQAFNVIRKYWGSQISTNKKLEIQSMTFGEP